MSSTRLVRSALALKAGPLFVLLGLGCSADPVDRSSHGDGSDDRGSDVPEAEGDRGAADPGDEEQPGDGTSVSAKDAGKAGGSDRRDAGSDAGAKAGSSDAGGGTDAGTKGGRSDAGSEVDAGKDDSGPSTGGAAGCEVSPITAEMRGSWANMNDPYYVKYASANGVIVATGSKVDDPALARYCHMMKEFTSNEDVRKAILADKMWFTMIGNEEELSSLPQINKQYGTSLNQRARGLGGLTPTICAEDSIMCSPGDKWKGDCICPHETGHTLFSSGIAKVPSLMSRLKTITADTRSSGRIANSYVWMDGNESGMMAWGVQVWYDCAINGTKGAYHPDINTRAELQKEMPAFYEFLSDLLPKENEYKDCYANK